MMVKSLLNQNFSKVKRVGPYTQAAVMSIAFDQPLATVDGNVFRVWSRLNNDYRDTKLQSTRKAFEQELNPYVQEASGTFNQAMMELGALICTRNHHYVYFAQFKKIVKLSTKGPHRNFL